MNFNNTFSENLIHNMIEVKFNTIKKVKDEWEQCWHLGRNLDLNLFTEISENLALIALSTSLLFALGTAHYS